MKMTRELLSMKKTRKEVCPQGNMVCLANSSYSLRATVLIFCRMFIHIIEMCMFTGFWSKLICPLTLRRGGIKMKEQN
jgi:hypothetical protein